MPPRLGPARDDRACSRAVSFLRKVGAVASHRVGSTVLGERTWATTRVLRERILAQQEEHANDMHVLLVTHECRPMLEK